MNVLGLFAGVGGLELGIGLAVRGARSVCYVERDAFAAAVLVARMEDATLAPAPVWDDVSTFDGRPWRGVVDCIAGGFPCQDISVAGLGAGLDGARSGLWSEYARIIREVGPRYVFVENVAALVTRGIDRVIGDLAELGFDAEWDVFSAAEVGAPHLRRRLFILAHANGAQREGDGGPVGVRQENADAGIRRGTVGYANSGRFKVEREPECRGEFGSYRDFHYGSDSHRGLVWPPTPRDAEGWRAYLAAGGPEPAVCRGADGPAFRVDRLRCLGNGVVPAVAARAWRELSERMR